MVAISLEDGFPMPLLRQRPHLVKTFTYEFRQPYHTAEKMPLDKAPNFISQVRTEARDLAYGAVHSVHANLRQIGCELRGCGLLAASGRPLPALPRILASHALIHTADGELFREALLHACKRQGVEILAVKESELLEMAGQALRMDSTELASRIADVGRPLGPPWSKDEKYATLVAGLFLL